MLLQAEPWLVRASVDGGSVSVPIRSALDWAQRIWADPGGSILALGVGQSDPEAIQLQRFTTAGELVASGQWAVGPNAVLAGAAPMPDSQLAVLARSERVLTVGRVTASTEVEVLGTLDFSSSPFGSDECCSREPTDFTVSPTGEFFLAGHLIGSNRVDALWFAALNADASPRAETFDTDFDLFPSNPRLSANSAGDVYAVWSWRFSRSVPVAAYAARLNAALGTLWRREPDGTEAITVANDVAALEDGAVIGGTARLLKPLERLNRKGDTLHVAFPTTPFRVEAIGSRAVLVLSNDDRGYALTSVSFEPLARVASGRGEACATAQDCSGAYCVLPCTDATCAAVCLPDCLAVGSEGCAALGLPVCAVERNTENVEVSVCRP